MACLLCRIRSGRNMLLCSLRRRGPIRLWDLLEGVELQEFGRPSREAFGLTVTPAEAHILWHGSPNG